LAVIDAMRKTPISPRGVNVVVWNGVGKVLYVR
jgi:hypothetical protein